MPPEEADQLGERGPNVAVSVECVDVSGADRGSKAGRDVDEPPRDGHRRRRSDLLIGRDQGQDEVAQLAGRVVRRSLGGGEDPEVASPRVMATAVRRGGL